MKTKRMLFQTGLLYAAALALGILDETLSHAQSGTQAWVQRYGTGAESIAHAVAVDGSGNIFVTGYSTGSNSWLDFATIAYSSTGVPLWTNRYNGPGNNYDVANAVAVDGSGNVFVAGASTGSGSGSDCTTIKYSGAGAPLWTNVYNGPGNNYDQANAVAVDASGNVFVTGISRDSANGLDYVTLKYSGAGAPLWTNRYNGPGNGDEIATSMAIDNNNNVIITGFSPGNGTGSDFATIAYSSDGVPLWTNRYNGTATGGEIANALAVDGNGNVFVTGTGYSAASGGTAGSDDYLTIAYSSAGVPLWTNYYNGPSNVSDSASAVAVDRNGNVFVTGHSRGSPSNAADYVTIGYSGVGVPIWTNRYNGPANRDDYAKSVVVDGRGNVFVTGYSNDNGHRGDFATIGYSNAGVPLWTNRYNGPANGGETIATEQSMAVTADGVVVVGGSDGDFTSGTIYDYAVVKYALSFKIIAAEKLGNDLRLSFTSQVGYHYTVQARTNLAAGDWINVMTIIPSSGALTQTTVSNAVLEPQQFYRIQESP